MSCTWRVSNLTDIPSSKVWPQWAQAWGTWSSTWSGASERRSVVPFCPPGLRPFTGVRFGAGGFLRPSLDGGLLLVVLFRPRRRSNSEINAACLATMSSNSRIRASLTARASTKACTSVVWKKGKRNVIGLDQKPLLTNCSPQGHVVDVRTLPSCHGQQDLTFRMSTGTIQSFKLLKILST